MITTIRRCAKHGPLVGVRYCPECASSGEPWPEDAPKCVDVERHSLETVTRCKQCGYVSSLSAWQPLETAPEANGIVPVNMLVAAESGAEDGTLVVAEAERDEDGNFWWANERGEYHASPINHRVRFWMPLPEAPSESA